MGERKVDMGYKEWRKGRPEKYVKERERNKGWGDIEDRRRGKEAVKVEN